MTITNYDAAMAGKNDKDEEMIRARVPAELRARWEAFTDARGISTQRALIAMIDFMLNEDPLVQLMILKQVPEGDYAALSEIVLKRLAERKAVKGGKSKTK